jgi:hypothetical protein
MHYAALLPLERINTGLDLKRAGRLIGAWGMVGKDYPPYSSAFPVGWVFFTHLYTTAPLPPAPHLRHHSP